MDRTTPSFLGSMSVNRLLFRLAFPSVLTTLTTVIYSLTDTFFIGKLGTEALGALTVSFPIFALIGSVGLVFGIGGASVISRFLGAGDNDKADTAGFLVISGVVVLGIIITGFSFTFLRKLLVVFGSTDTILPYAYRYARILVFGSFLTIINMSLSYTIRAEGNVRFTMIAMVTGTVANIILDPLFIFVFGFGIEGAGVATVAAQFITGCFYLLYYRSRRAAVRIRFHRQTGAERIGTEIVKIGIPSLINQGLLSIVIAVLNTIAGQYGDAALGAIGIVIRVFFFAVYLIFGFCRGLQPIVGFNYGAGKLERVRSAAKTAAFWLTVFSLLFGIFLLLFPARIMMLFSSSTEMINLGSKLLRSIGLLFPFFGFEAVMITLYQALGAAVPAALLALVRQGFLLVPVVLILYPFFGLDGLIYSFPVNDFLVLLITVFFAVRLRRILSPRSAPLMKY